MGARWKRLVIRMIRVPALAYIGICLVLFLWQDHFIFPGAETQGRPEAILRGGGNAELLDLRGKDGTKIAALSGKTIVGDPASAPSVIFFYGNGACLAYSTDIFDHF